MQFSVLALIEAGTIKAGDDTLAIMQGVSLEHAHTIARWLALSTDTAVKLQWMTIGQVEDISYTPEQVKATIQKPQRKPLHCGTCGNDWKDCTCTPQDLD